MRLGREWLFASTVAGFSLVALAVGVASVDGFGVSASPCSLVSRARIEKDLGLADVKETPVTGMESSVDGGVVASTCKNIIAWSGIAPTTPQQFAAKLADGTGALMAIRTFVPDTSAPNASQWVTSGFQTKLSRAIGDCDAYSRLMHGHTVSLPSDGAQSAAGDAGATSAQQFTICGVWDRSDSSRIVFVLLETSRHKPGIKEFKRITNAAVPRFW